MSPLTKPSIFTLILGFIFTILTTIPTIVLYVVFHLYRYWIGLYLSSKHGHPVQFLEDGDALMALKDQNGPFTIHGYHILKGEPDIVAFRKRVQKVWVDAKNPNGSRRHKKLRQCLHRELGYSFWLPNRNFNIEEQIIMYEGPQLRTMNDFHRLFGEKITEHFPSGLSPWQWILIPIPDEFLGLDIEPHYILFWTCIHALTDGVAGIRLLCELFDDPFDEIPPKKPNVTSFAKRIEYAFHCICLGPLYLARDLCTRENHILRARKLTGTRLAGFSIPIEVERFKRVKNETGTTINDIIVACWAGALRRHFVSENAEIPDNVNAHFPISLHDLRKRATFVNKVSAVMFRIPVAEPETPLDRLMACQKIANSVKESPTVLYQYYVVFKYLCSVLPNWLIAPLIDIYAPTAIASNVPGPQQLCSIFGNQLLRMCFLVPTRATAGLGLSALSLQGSIQFGVRVDTAIIQKQEIVERFLKDINIEFEELEKTVYSSSILN